MQDDRLLALIDADRRRLVRAATRLRGPADAEDAVQDAYVRALEAEAPALDVAQAMLRRAFSRLRSAGGARLPDPELEPGEETVFRLYLQSLQQRDPHQLWAMLHQPPVSASLGRPAFTAEAAPVPPASACCIVQVGGRLGLVLTLDGATLCVLPLGARAEFIHTF